MATALKLEDTGAVAGTDIVAVVTQNPGLVLLDRAKFTDFYERMKAETDKLVPDVTTNKGRDEIRSMAARVVRSKTAIEAARLELTKGWREQVDAANAAGKEIKAQMEALAEEVRAPLTAWEEAEKARVESCRADIEAFRRAGIVSLDETAADVRDRGADLWKQEVDPERFGEMAEEAQAAKDASVASLKAALERLTREEADRAELERLRAENEAREAKETAEREARECAEQEAEAARQAEARKAEAERAEAERIANAEREAAERATREAEQRHAAELAAERARAEEAERSAQAERDRVAAAEAARVAEEERVAAEQAKRDADQAHKSKIMKAAKEAIMTCGVDEDAAKKVVLLIRAGEVPNVTLRF